MDSSAASPGSETGVPGPCDEILNGDRSSLRVGVISNPHSGRNRRQLPRISGMFEQQPRIVHTVTNAATDIDAAIRRFASEKVRVVVLNGGDGSVAHALSAIFDGESPSPPPLLCALPGGTTNVTVGDVGIRGSLPDAALRLLGWMNQPRAPAQILRRPVIRVSDRDGRSLGCGLVFGAGAVVDGIEYWQEQVRSRGMRSELSSGVAMIRTVWGMLRGHSGFSTPLTIGIAFHGRHPDLSGEFMLLVISALDRLFLGIHPFWGSTHGALRFTAIERGAHRFAALLPSILVGKPATSVTTATGYHSNAIDSIELAFHGGFTLDGELHHVGANESPVTVSCAGYIDFLRV